MTLKCLGAALKWFGATLKSFGMTLNYLRAAPKSFRGPPASLAFPPEKVGELEGLIRARRRRRDGATADHGAGRKGCQGPGAGSIQDDLWRHLREYVFPAAGRSRDPRSGVERRHHLTEPDRIGFQPSVEGVTGA